jgi:nitric oxide reductase NorQ protein
MVVPHEAVIECDQAAALVRFGQPIRRLETPGLHQLASTRVLVAAGRLIARGLTLRQAACAAIARPLSNDPTVISASWR